MSPPAVEDYDALQKSRHSGLPIECYRFVQGTEEYRYTSADETIPVVGFGGFTPTEITRSNPDYSQEGRGGSIEVYLPHNDPVVVLVASQPVSPVTLTIFSTHEGISGYVVGWFGRVFSVSLENGVAKLACVPMTAAARKKVPRFARQRLCNHVLYGPGCGVDRLAFRDTATITGVAGVLVRASIFATHPDGWYDAGYLELTTGGRQYIRSHNGEYVTLMGTLAGLVAGVSAYAFPGCAHDEVACGPLKFNNTANFGAFERRPIRNPWAAGMA